MTTRARHRGRIGSQSVQRRPLPSIKRTWLTLGTATTRASLLFPGDFGGYRLARIWVVVETAESVEKPLEIYFGLGATAAVDTSKIVDIMLIKAIGMYTTRTYETTSVDRAPTSLKDEFISYRWVAAPVNNHRALIEYRENMSNRLSDFVS